MSKKLRLTMKTAMTLQEGIAEFYLNCEARNLRPGTIKHYKDSVVQIYESHYTDISIVESNDN